MVILKRVILLFIFLVSSVFAAEKSYLLKEAKVSCELTEYCEDYQNKFNDILGAKFSLTELKDKLRFMLFDSSIERFSYSLYLTKGGFLIDVNLRQKKKVRLITFEASNGADLSFLKRFLPFKEESFYQRGLNQKAYAIIEKYLKDRGYEDSDLLIIPHTEGLNVDLLFRVDVGKVRRIKRIEILGIRGKNQRQLKKRFQSFVDLTWDGINLKVEVDQVAQELFNSGYFSSKVELETLAVGKDKIDIIAKIRIHYGKKVNFYFRGNTLFTQLELLSFMRGSMKESLGDFTEEDLVTAISEEYKKRGYYNNKITFSSQEGLTKETVFFKNYYFKIEEGHKVKIQSLDFIGNDQLQTEIIKEIYSDNATELADRELLDEEYLKKFTSLLKTEYLRKGFVFASIKKPVINFVNDREVIVEIKIQEKQQSILRKIHLRNTPSRLALKVKSMLVNKEGAPLNIVTLESDINNVLDIVREEGYYYARIANLEDNKFLQYSSNYNEVVIDLVLALQKKSYLDDLVITGRSRTRREVITREIDIKKGDIITPKKLELIENRLNSLGLFSQVDISPSEVNRNTKDKDYRVKLIVRVKERDFGTAELAPGFRTDLGAKFSAEILWKNLGGMNRSSLLKAQANYRFNLNSLDTRRKTANRKLVEGAVEWTYTEPYLFGAKYEFDSTIAAQRKRFFSFDANIARFSPKIAKTFNKYFSSSLKYQFEFVDQFDATDSKDDGKFRIGGLTPSISLDFRDNAVSTTSGALFNLSWEVATPFFGSEKDDELEVNYHRLVSRNNFYIPFSNNFILAISYSMGFEKNLANKQKTDAAGNLLFNTDGLPTTEGFIPSIKVFRLDGFTTVRGFADNEINRLDSEADISQVTITDKAYFANLKIEPRYFLSDNTMLALFFDAGRVFVDHFQPLDLRTAAGVSFKFLTPVGSLDFDYGVKLRRRRLSNAAREGFGRFHLTIGFF